MFLYRSTRCVFYQKEVDSEKFKLELVCSFANMKLQEQSSFYIFSLNIILK